MYKLTVNDSYHYELTKSKLDSLDLLEHHMGPSHLLYENRGYAIEFLEEDVDKGLYTLKVDGALYTVKVADGLDLLIEEMGFELSSSGLVGEVEAPMPGLILDIMVKEGDKVNEGDPLLILEAMKMENVLTSPTKGTVQNVNVKKGDSVEKKQVLLNFE